LVNYPSNDVRCQHVDVCVVAAGMQNGCAAIGTVNLAERRGRWEDRWPLQCRIRGTGGDHQPLRVAVLPLRIEPA